MLANSIVSWLHFLGVFTLVGSLAVEFILFRREMSATAQRQLRATDLHYGIAAAIVLVTGLLRVFWFGKGAEFYAGNPFFWVLVALFAAIGLLSLPPTMFFRRWRGSTQLVTVTEADFHRVRRFLWLEAALLALAPLAAVLMARGVSV